MLALILLGVLGYTATAGCSVELFFRGLWDGNAYDKADIRGISVFFGAFWPVSGPLALVYLLGRQAQKLTGRVLDGRASRLALPEARTLRTARDDG